MSHNLFDDTFVITSLNPHKKRFARGKDQQDKGNGAKKGGEVGRSGEGWLG